MTILTFDPAYLEDILVPIFVCFALPVCIVFLVMWAKRNETDRKAEVALKAIEAGIQVDPTFFGKSDAKTEKPKSIKEKVFANLKTGLILAGLGIASLATSFFSDGTLKDISKGCTIFLFLGIAFIVYFFIARKHFAKEIEAEETGFNKAE